MKRVLGSTLGSLLFCELALRLAGLGPWVPFEDFRDVPPLSDAHAELGWVNRPGRHAFPGAAVHIAADGTRGSVGDGATRVGLYGGSFVFGYGLGESEVMSARLTAARPDLSVRNHGVPGYGTLQSQLLEASVAAEQVVIYGLNDLHDARNAGAWSWLAGLEKASAGQGWAQTPSAWWDGQSLHTSAPQSYRHWRLSESIALVDRFERSVIAVHDRFLRTKSETTVQLVLRFRDQVEQRDARFAVAMLNAPKRQDFYLRRLREEGVELLDLRHESIDEWALADGHPDARVHAAWAEQLAGAL